MSPCDPYSQATTNYTLAPRMRALHESQTPQGTGDTADDSPIMASTAELLVQLLTRIV